jgi:hypothetical protein
MPPLRVRELRASTTNPTLARRQAKSLRVDVDLANDIVEPVATGRLTHELDSAFAAKEKELSRLWSPLVTRGSHSVGEMELPHSVIWSIPEVIDSFESFQAMRAVVLPYLLNNDMGHLIPESKLYRSFYFPYRWDLLCIQIDISRSNLTALIEGQRFKPPLMPLRHLSLLDRYWQLRLRLYRRMFETHRVGPFLTEHCFPIYKQLLVDIHPIFGAYVLYLRALQLYVLSDLEGTMDYLQFAMDWIASWRIPGNRWDLTEQVRFQNVALITRRCINRWVTWESLFRLKRIQNVRDCGTFAPKIGWRTLQQRMYEIPFGLANPKIYVSPEARKPKQEKWYDE